MCIFDDLATSELISNDQKKADVLNQGFQAVFVNPNEVQVCSLCHFTKFVSADRVPFDDSDISLEQVLKILHKLSINQAPDIDCIFNTVLQKTATCLAEPLALLYNRCLLSGKYPLSWKRAVVKPLHKGGSQSQCANYCPFS